MLEIHCMKNARNQKSTFDLSWTMDLTTIGTVLSARVVINFEKFLEGILFVNLVRFLFKKLKNFKNYFFIIEL